MLIKTTKKMKIINFRWSISLVHVQSLTFSVQTFLKFIKWPNLRGIQYNRIINTKNDLLYVESQINNLPKKLNYFKNHVIILISILLQKKVDRNLEAGKSLFSLSSFNFQKYTISKPKNIIFYLVSNAYLSMVFFSDNCSIFQQKINTCRRIS